MNDEKIITEKTVLVILRYFRIELAKILPEIAFGAN
jgi:hypothetical protein